jgi:hypothetical protein
VKLHVEFSTAPCSLDNFFLQLFQSRQFVEIIYNVETILLLNVTFLQALHLAEAAPRFLN